MREEPMTAEDVLLINAREVLEHQRELRALQLDEQRAKTAKAETELR